MLINGQTKAMDGLQLPAKVIFSILTEATHEGLRIISNGTGHHSSVAGQSIPAENSMTSTLNGEAAVD